MRKVSNFLPQRIWGHKRHTAKTRRPVRKCGEDMTERMSDAFVVRDTNGTKNMIPSQRERPMAMGDGTFMADNAFRESVPMMSYTPEELGINMSAYPTAPQEETAFEIAMQDKSQSGDMPSMTPMEEVTLCNLPLILSLP